ncbi:hypothetical protein VF21_04606 [Pseudogymnoascus sp. 05NY08]|nr:hypothetical protein VF21_04606 [Pseudogymnoascus sp. 05NY08]
MQKHSPAQVVSSILYKTLDKSVTKYTYIDFCAGAGGPTPCIERELNQKLAKTKSSSEDTRPGATHVVNGEHNESVRFVMTDLHPHIADWKEACSKSKNLTFVSEPVDATNASADLILNDGKKVFRMFNLAFHHFDDSLGRNILKNTLETSDGFGIFELSERTPSSLLMITLMGLLFFFITPFYFWRSPGHLFFTYIIPIIPFVVVFDGYVSSLLSRPFRLCNVSPEERTTWCMQTAYELALLKNTAFHYGDAFGKVVAVEETKLLLTNIIEMNSKGRSTLAAILEAMVGLEKTMWSVVIEEEVQNELASIVRFDGHCRARLVAMNIIIEKIAETKEMIAVTEQRAMAEQRAMTEQRPITEQRAMTANPWAQTWSSTEGPENSEAPSPEQEPVETEEGENVEGETETPAETSVVEAEETLTYRGGGSDSQHANTEKTEDVAPSEKATEERTPRSHWRPQFGSMSLAEAENYSTWRGSRTI